MAKGVTPPRETMPTFQGGDVNSFARWVGANVSYPEELDNENIGGRVIVRFVVNTDGSLSDYDVLADPHPALTAAVLEAMRRAPKWKPGMIGSTPARVSMTIPITFTKPNTPGVKMIFDGPILDLAQIDTPPAFHDPGLGTIDEWLHERVAASKKLQKAEPRNVGVMFVIEPDGSVSSVRVRNSTNNAVIKELSNIVQEKMPRCVPGRHEGRAVRTHMTMVFAIGTPR
jgi:TonB family protein